jgi:hypothetical protein
MVESPQKMADYLLLKLLNLLLCTGIDIGVHGKHIPSQG